MSRCRDVLKHKRIEDRVSGDLIDGMVFWEGLYADHPENWLWGRLKGYLGQKSVLEVVAAWVYAIEIRRKAHQIRF